MGTWAHFSDGSEQEAPPLQGDVTPHPPFLPPPAPPSSQVQLVMLALACPGPAGTEEGSTGSIHRALLRLQYEQSLGHC